ncbi:MAG: hypothetical protein OER96_00855 [Gammaproteobacteria bacterium]|nr:hypothetical protein [Gammaproteobacteria bacterium]
MQQTNIHETRRNCEDPYLVPGLNHPCNGLYRDEVSASGELHPTTNTRANINNHVKCDQMNSPVFACMQPAF